MLVMVNFWAQRVPCGTSPKLWVMTAGAGCSRLVAMSGRKNLLAQGAGWAGAAGCAGAAGGCATAPAVRPNTTPTANQVEYLIRCLLRAGEPADLLPADCVPHRTSADKGAAVGQEESPPDATG